MSRGTSAFRLPGGYFDSNHTLHGEVELAPLSGRDEELLVAPDWLPAAAVTSLLSRCITRLGTLAHVNEDTVRRLLVADRQFALLKLRALTFGPKVQGSCLCEWDDCGERIGLNFSLEDIPVKQLVNKQPAYELLVSANARAEDGAALVPLLLRLPTGEDQEVLCSTPLENEAHALRLLVQRCLLSVNGGSAEHWIDKAAPSTLYEIERFLLATAPALDLDVRPRCPGCQRELTVHFDLQDFFFGDLAMSAELLHKEVHYLAFHYHWSEREILDLPRTKRQKYIQVLADELEALNANA